LAVEQATFEFELAQFATQLRQADVDLATDSVERRRVVAPLDGVVVQMNRREGEWVEASKPLFRILRLDRLRAEGFVQAMDAKEDLVGNAVVLSVTLPGGRAEQYPGEIVFVSPEISPVNGQMRVWAEVENPRLELRPGVRGTLRITLAGEGTKP
jgi:macrolide-specific efflux system membrane fusion protein